jgi:hypothetical protein
MSLTAATPAPGSSEPDDGDELIGTTVAGRYLVKGVIGRGGMGVVLEALHAELGQAYALKVLGRQFVRDDAVVRRFIREARTVAQIGHPHIVAVHDLGVLEDGRPYLAMERVHGQTLRERLRTGGPLSPAETAEILSGVAEALEVVHARGIVHRDVKLENIMLAEQHAGPPVAKLLDFGVATMTTPEAGSSRITQHGMLLGTPLYLPPEAGEAAAVDARWDVYALGVVCYALMTTRWPFDGDTPLVVLTQKLLHAPPPLSDDERVFDDAVERVVAAALATAPEERTSSPRALITGLAAAASRSPHGGVRGRVDPASGSARETELPRAAPSHGAETAGGSIELESHAGEAGAHTLAAAGLRRSPRGGRWIVAAAVGAGVALALVVLRPEPVAVPIVPVADPRSAPAAQAEAAGGRASPQAAAEPPAATAAKAPSGPTEAAPAPSAPAPSAPAPSAPAPSAPAPSALAPPAPVASSARSTPSPSGASSDRVGETRGAPPSALAGPAPASPASVGGLASGAEASEAPARAPAPDAPSGSLSRPGARPGADEPGLDRRARVLPARAELPTRPEATPPVPPAPTPRIADPERAARLTREGLDALLAGDLARAVEVLDQATRADERHVPAWRVLATATDRAGRTARAREAYRRYLALADDREDARVVERARKRLAELDAAR